MKETIQLPTLKEIIDHYQMQPHPEGGYFVETYRSSLVTQTSRGERAASTAIMFLITAESISHFHRLTSDEGWHFYGGDPLKLYQINPQGELSDITIGPNFKEGQKLQHIVPAGDWFASTSHGEYSLVGCTVAPGFDFSDFEMAKKADLKVQFPQHAEILERFCLN